MNKQINVIYDRDWDELISSNRRLVMNKNKIWLAILAVTLISNFFLCGCGKNQDEKPSLKLSLTTNENIEAWSGFMASFDENKINQILDKRPIKKVAIF